MTPLLPLNATEIRLEWPIEQGGFGVTAKTDEMGTPIVGLYPLYPNGVPAGQPTEYAHQQLMIRIVVGYDDHRKAITVFADIVLTSLGLSLRVIMPLPMMERGYDRYLFISWGSRLQ